MTGVMALLALLLIISMREFSSARIQVTGFAIRFVMPKGMWLEARQIEEELRKTMYKKVWHSFDREQMLKVLEGMCSDSLIEVRQNSTGIAEYCNVSAERTAA